jgi:hypothetical protein
MELRFRSENPSTSVIVIDAFEPCCASVHISSGHGTTKYAIADPIRDHHQPVNNQQQST